jgi:hypothetical protein
MSRHGYVDDDWDESSQWAMIRWRGAVRAAERGAKGQKFFRDLVEALDAMPVKELHVISLAGDCVCAMGALARHRGVDMSKAQTELEDEDGDHEWATEFAGDILGIAPALAKEVAYENDEGVWSETPAQRWARMRRWAAAKIAPAQDTPHD